MMNSYERKGLKKIVDFEGSRMNKQNPFWMKNISNIHTSFHSNNWNVNHLDLCKLPFAYQDN